MARYRIENCIIDTKNATESWEEDCGFDGHNYISKATGSQWNHEKLYKSRKGRYYVEHWSQWQGSRPWAEWISPEEALRWLIINNHDTPDELEQYVEKVTE